jgi:exosortase K
MDLAQQIFTGKRHIKMILLKKPLIQNIILCLTTLSIAWALKYHYSIANAEHLKWILAPTAALVESITGHPFYFETSSGYINHELQIIIAPACAGVNFLIAAFGISVFCGIFTLSGFQKKCFWLITCAAGVYLATISVNAFRIWISIATIAADIHAGWFTPQRVHRMSGILIYFFFLSIFYHIIQKIIQMLQIRRADLKNRTARQHRPEIRTAQAAVIGLYPLICYWSITILVPWANHAYEKNPVGFMEHCGMVGIGSICIFMLLFSLKPVVNIFKLRISQQP